MNFRDENIFIAIKKGVGEYIMVHSITVHYRSEFVHKICGFPKNSE